jgi:cellulose biosynthesis protein BcsE
MFSDSLMFHVGGMVSPAASLMPGNVYAVIEDGIDIASSLIGATLLDAAEGAGHVCLISSRKGIASVLGRSDACVTLAHAVATAHIAVLQYEAPSDPAPAARLGAGLIEEIEHFGHRGNALIVIDEAERFLTDDEARQNVLMRQWRNWAEERNNIVLLVYRGRAQDNDRTLTALLAAMRCLGGLVRIRDAYQATIWEIFHWFHERGAQAGTSLRLERDTGGKFALSEHRVLQDVEAAADDKIVFAVRAALLPTEQALPCWQMLGELDEMQFRASGAQAATVVLGFSSAISFERVARCVFALRQKCGPRLKIVVREVNVRMRQNQEALAIHLGANLIIPSGISLSRVASLMAMVQGQVFPHILPASYEEGLADVMPLQEQGYLAPDNFISAVSAHLARSQARRAQSVLVVLPLAYKLAPLDALRYCHIERDGDLYTADQGNVYLFLSACRDADVGQTLERLFRLPVSELFDGENRFLTLSDIKQAVNELALCSARGALPDLAPELALIEREAHGAPAQMRALIAKIEKNGPQENHYSAPAPSVRRALPVRESERKTS